MVRVAIYVFWCIDLNYSEPELYFLPLQKWAECEQNVETGGKATHLFTPGE